jgi:hypothetical protein
MGDVKFLTLIFVFLIQECDTMRSITLGFHFNLVEDGI